METQTKLFFGEVPEGVEDINDGRLYVFSNYDKGVICPCCDQFAKKYKRKFNSTMARALIIIYRAGRDWVHLEELFKNTPKIPSSIRSNASILRWWQMIRRKEGEKDDGNPNNGFYKITDLGIAFVENRITTKRYVYTYNNKVLEEVDDEQINIYTALTDKFNYNELMGKL